MLLGTGSYRRPARHQSSLPQSRFSRLFLTSWRKLAEYAPSKARWSHDNPSMPIGNDLHEAVGLAEDLGTRVADETLLDDDHVVARGHRLLLRKASGVGSDLAATRQNP